MVGRRRRRIPEDVAAEVLFRANHTCCICNVQGQDVHIHHIDGSSSNNDFDNLAVVCLACHSLVTGPRGLGRAYTPAEVRRYKRAWEQQILESRRIRRPIIRYQKELVGQIDLIVCEILASRRNRARVATLLGMLWELHLWRGTKAIDRKIVEGLRHLALMSGLDSPSLAGMVAEKLWEMCFHFVGPDNVPMDKHGLTLVLECVEGLETLASFNCEFGHGRKASEVIAKHMEKFFEIGLWYGKRRIVNAVLDSYEKALKVCYEAGRIEFPHGRRVLRRSVRRVRKMLGEERPGWRSERNRIATLLRM